LNESAVGRFCPVEIIFLGKLPLFKQELSSQWSWAQEPLPEAADLKPNRINFWNREVLRRGEFFDLNLLERVENGGQVELSLGSALSRGGKEEAGGRKECVRKKNAQTPTKRQLKLQGCSSPLVPTLL
jgi:hypothetical protein